MKNKTKTDKQKQNTTRNETIKQNKNKNSETNKRVSRPCHIAPPPASLQFYPKHVVSFVNQKMLVYYADQLDDAL